ncbi:MAG: hypothetical protein LBF88_10545 [Planctomycetaceae bacterium]|jgi:uncharacterized protein YecE (DUF72 family)|nr:hypothetical protein [Planctomycetaceae bacterium]
MRRRSSESLISLFSFQDIIMSVVGIIILITLLLILKLIMQMSLAESVPASTVSVQELTELIEPLKSSLRDIQDETAEMYKKKQESQIWAPTQDQIDALQSVTGRLDTEIEEIRQSIKKANQHLEELKQNQFLKLAEEKEKQIKQLRELLEQLTEKNKELTQQQKELQTKENELREKNTELDKIIIARDIPQLLISTQKTSDKTPYILIYGQNGINVISIDGSINRYFSTRNQLNTWLKNCNKETEFFVLFVRPSRFARYEEILNDLQLKGFDVGLQVIGETTEFSINNENE